jgi:uncharacterized membrane protein
MISREKQAKVAWILAAAMLLNMFIATYIELQEISISSGKSPITGDVCFINSTTSGVGDCFKVQASPYSSLFGVSIAGWGMIIFLFMTVAMGSFAMSIKKNKPISFYEQARFRRLLFLVFILATLFALGFLYIQFFVIGALCKYCTILDTITIVSAIVFFITFKRD